MAWSCCNMLYHFQNGVCLAVGCVNALPNHGLARVKDKKIGGCRAAESCGACQHWLQIKVNTVPLSSCIHYGFHWQFSPWQPLAGSSKANIAKYVTQTAEWTDHGPNYRKPQRSPRKDPDRSPGHPLDEKASILISCRSAKAGSVRTHLKRRSKRIPGINGNWRSGRHDSSLPSS